MTERALVAAAKSEEPGALEALFRLHAPQLLRTAHQITRSHQDAEDAVQDSFLNALRHLKSFDGRSTLSTWLTRICINSALMILRKKRKSREMSIYDSAEGEPMWEVTDSAPNPETMYAQRERDTLVRCALQRLSPRFRRALELQMFQGNSLEQTALQMGISVPAAKSQLSRAREVIRKSKAVRNINSGDWRRDFWSLQRLQGEIR